MDRYSHRQKKSVLISRSNQRTYKKFMRDDNSVQEDKWMTATVVDVGRRAQKELRIKNNT